MTGPQLARSELENDRHAADVDQALCNMRSALFFWPTRDRSLTVSVVVATNRGLVAERTRI